MLPVSFRSRAVVSSAIMIVWNGTNMEERNTSVMTSAHLLFQRESAYPANALTERLSAIPPAVTRQELRNARGKSAVLMTAA